MQFDQGEGLDMAEQVYTNYRLQLPEGESLGTLVVRDGCIADVQPGVVPQGHDGQGAIPDAGIGGTAYG